MAAISLDVSVVRPNFADHPNGTVSLNCQSYTIYPSINHYQRRLTMIIRYEPFLIATNITASGMFVCKWLTKELSTAGSGQTQTQCRANSKAWWQGLNFCLQQPPLRSRTLLSNPLDHDCSPARFPNLRLAMEVPVPPRWRDHFLEIRIQSCQIGSCTNITRLLMP